MKTFEVAGLKKYYGRVKALDGVTLSAESGTVFGLLGPNGAGKTTLIRILSTLISQTEGQAKVLGVDITRQPDKVREIIGLAGQYAAVDEYLTGRENMHMVGRLYHLGKAETSKRTEKILSRLNLLDAADRQVKTYSGGMRRRLDLGACLVGQPKVMFLDEPTTGLDPSTRLDLWEIIKDLKKSGTGIILTTQYLEEADELADKIAVIDKGKVIAEGTSDKLKRQIGGGEVVEIYFENEKDLTKSVAPLGKSTKSQLKKSDTNALGLIISSSNGTREMLAAVETLNKIKVKPKSISLHKPSLDNVFLTLTGKPAVNETSEE